MNMNTVVEYEGLFDNVIFVIVKICIMLFK